MFKNNKFIYKMAFVSALFLFAPATFANSPPYPISDQDVNSDTDTRLDLRQTQIARVSLLDGEASIQPLYTEEWDTVFVNSPISKGDLIYTGKNTRMELEVNGGFVRLGDYTSLEVVELSPTRYRFDITAGTATFSLKQGRPQDVEIATPLCSLTINKDGVYRVNVSEIGNVEVVVHKGDASLLGQTGNFQLREGRRAVFNAENPTDVEVLSNILSDYWDGFNDERDNLALINNNSYTYVREPLSGLSDLDAYGNWVDVPDYGWSWQPNNVNPGWAPYRDGRWNYYPSWGWTWVSNEPWGWAPYHYGSWAFLANYGWVWVPSNINSYYWSPALVSWYYVNYNNVNYVCWHPRDRWAHNNNQPVQPLPPVPTPVTPRKPHQPKEHDGNGGKGRVQPIDPSSFAFNGGGVTILPITDFAKGGKPVIPAGEIIDRVRGNGKVVIVGQLPKPSKTVIPAPEAAPRPRPETISRPVISRYELPASNKPRHKAPVDGTGQSTTTTRPTTQPATTTRPVVPPSDKQYTLPSRDRSQHGNRPIKNPYALPGDQPVANPGSGTTQTQPGTTQTQPATGTVTKPQPRPAQPTDPSGPVRPHPQPVQPAQPAQPKPQPTQPSNPKTFQPERPKVERPNNDSAKPAPQPAEKPVERPAQPVRPNRPGKN